MGADEAVLVKDDAPETYDGLRTARIIARAVERKFAGADLLLFGKQVGRHGQQPGALDGGRAPRPAPGERGDEARDRRQRRDGPAREIEGGMEKVVFSLPAVVSAQKGLNEPRYETLKGIMAAKKKEIPVVKLEELGLTAEELAPKVVITGLDVPPQRQAGRILQGEPAETARELAALLRNEAKVI